MRKTTFSKKNKNKVTRKIKSKKNTKKYQKGGTVSEGPTGNLSVLKKTKTNRPETNSPIKKNSNEYLIPKTTPSSGYANHNNFFSTPSKKSLSNNGSNLYSSVRRVRKNLPSNHNETELKKLEDCKNCNKIIKDEVCDDKPPESGKRKKLATPDDVTRCQNCRAFLLKNECNTPKQTRQQNPVKRGNYQRILPNISKSKTRKNNTRQYNTFKNQTQQPEYAVLKGVKTSTRQTIYNRLSNGTKEATKLSKASTKLPNGRPPATLPKPKKTKQ